MEDDLELAVRWREGDKRAGARLFERNYVSIERFFRNKVSHGLEDLIQRTFLICVETKDRFRGASSYRTYLFAIANNVLRNHYRSARRDRERLDFGTHSVADLAPGMSSLVRGKEEQSVLLQALREIPLDYQIVLELYYWEELDGKEISAALDIPLGTARSRIRIGKERLERKLTELHARDRRPTETQSNLDDWARAVRELVLNS